MIKKAGAGGTVLLLADAGDYKVTKEISIAAKMASTVTIKGVDKAGNAMDAHIEGTRPAEYAAGNPAGNELFKFQAGTANLKFQNLEIANTGTAFRAAGDISNITIEHVDADNVSRFFEDYAGGNNKTATVSGLTIRDVDVEGFSRGVIRLQYDSHDILIEDVRGDSERQDGDNFAIGVHLAGTVHDVMINRATMENATATNTGNYWNGDGFATESGVRNVVFQDTISRGNTDAGYDLKSKDTTLINALAEDNSRNYRIWGDVEMIDSTGLDPNKRGGALNGQGQIWIAKGAHLTVDGGYFADAGSSTGVFYNEGGSFTVTNTEVVYAAGAKLSTGWVGGLATLDVETVAAVGKTSSDAGVLVVPAPPAVVTVVTPTFTKVVSSTASDKLVGTDKSDHFVFDQSKKLGSDTITGFSKTDLLVTLKALADGNGDGLITFGVNGVLDLGSKAGTVKVANLTSGVRALGHTDEGYIYGDASVRPIKALEGKLGAADTLTGDKGDKAVTKFFVDNALDMAMGNDKLVNFGAKDILVTTAKLGDGAVGSKLAADASGFAVVNAGHDLGHLAITDVAGKAVTALEFDGDHVAGGVHYYIYSLVGSAAGLHDLGM